MTYKVHFAITTILLFCLTILFAYAPWALKIELN